MKNIFQNIPKHIKEEVFDTVLDEKAFRIERIVSEGHSTPHGEWLEQEENEWVILLSGKAVLSFQDGAPDIKMSPGDNVLISSGRSHRVEWTDPSQKTVWLAVHFK